MVKIICPKCKREIEFSENQLGEVATCDSCKTSFIADRPPKINIPPVPSLSDDESREIKVGGVLYSRKTIRRLKRRFCAFFVLFLLQFAALCSGIICGLERYDKTFTADCFLIALLIYFPLLITYLLFLRALKESAFLFWVKLLFLFLLFIPAMFANPLVLGLVYLLFSIGVFHSISHADDILLSATVLPATENRLSGFLKKYSYILLPLLVSLILSAVFLRSQKLDVGLCRDCGIWCETTETCFLGIKVASSAKYLQTAFPSFLDPGNQCRHRNGKTHVSRSEIHYVLKSMGLSLSALLDNNMPGYRPPQGISINKYEQQRMIYKKDAEEWFDKYMKDMTNLEEFSSFYWYLERKKMFNSFAVSFPTIPCSMISTIFFKILVPGT